jgi:hypothetical protein
VPTSFVGLTIFVAFLTPGFLYTSRRRAKVPTAERSSFMETASVVSVSLATNAVALIGFSLVRWAKPEHTPDVSELLTNAGGYAVERLPYVLGWAAGLLAVSCALAALAAADRVRTQVEKVFPPVIEQTSAWIKALNAPEGHWTHAGVELADGRYLGGQVAWFSTELAETGDRELLLAAPVTAVGTDGEEHDLAMVDRVVVAARDMRWINVTYVRGDPPAPRPDPPS